VAQHEAVGRESGSAVRPKRSKIVGLYTDPPSGSTVICVDEPGPVTPRAFWYDKLHPTFSVALALMREELWTRE
jgi:hypothetical protein